MSNLNEVQFAKYSARQVPVGNPADGDYDYEPLPATMERHAPGQYQPTLPGMEKMVPGEQTHTSVFFKHPNAVHEEEGDVPGSRWSGGLDHEGKYRSLTSTEKPEHVDLQTNHLHPVQDWVDDHYLHEEHKPPKRSMRWGADKPAAREPLIEKVSGLGNVVHDGHHRVAREILNGKKSIRAQRWQS